MSNKTSFFVDKLAIMIYYKRQERRFMEKLIDDLELLLKQVNEKANDIMIEAEDLKSELELLQDKYNNLENDLQENYKPIDKYKFYEINKSDFE